MVYFHLEVEAWLKPFMARLWSVNQAMEAGKPACMSHLMAGHPAYEGRWGGPRQAHYLLQLIYV